VQSGVKKYFPKKKVSISFCLNSLESPECRYYYLSTSLWKMENFKYSFCSFKEKSQPK